MADLGGPDYEMQLAELEMRIAQQELNIKSASLRKRQIEAELKKLSDNSDSAAKAIAEMELQIAEIKTKL